MSVRIQGGGELDGAVLSGAATAALQEQIIQTLGGVSRTVQDGNREREQADMNWLERTGTAMVSGVGAAAVGGLKGTTETLAGVTGNLLQGNYQLTDQTQVLSDSFRNLGTGSTLVDGAFSAMAGGVNSVVKYVQETADTFRGMSDVGGGLEGDLLTLRVAAANTRMPLDEFAGMVTENSTKLLALGGSVDEGTRAFVKQSKSFFDSNLGLGVQALGIGFEESNQYLLDYLDAQRRNEKFQQMDERDRRKAAQAYMYELDTLARLTGKSRKELQDDARQRMRAGQTQAALRQIENRTGQDVTAAYQGMAKEINGSLGPGFADMFDSMVALNGAIDPTNEAMKGLYASAPEAAESMSQAARLMNQGDTEGAQRMMEQAQAQALQRMNSDEYLSMARLGSLGGAVGQASTDLLEQNQDFVDAVNKQIEQTGRAATSAGDFADALQRARENIAVAQKTTQRSETMGTVVAGETLIRDSAAAMMSQIDSKMRPEIEATFGAIRDSIAGIDVETEIRDVLRRAGAMFDTQGVDALINNLNRIAADPEASRQTVETANRLLSEAEASRAILESGSATDQQRQEAETQVARIRGQIVNDVATLNRSTAEGTSTTLSRVGDSIIEAFNGGVSVDGTFTADNANFPNANFPDAPVTAGPDDGSRPGMSSGTVGEFGRLFADFGQETIAALHGREMVATPEQLQAGLSSFAENLLGAGGGFMPRMSESITASANNNVSPTQSEMPDLTVLVDGIRNALQESNTETSEMLNNKLSELTGYAARQLDVNTKHLKASRNLGGDIFKGLGF